MLRVLFLSTAWFSFLGTTVIAKDGVAVIVDQDLLPARTALTDLTKAIKQQQIKMVCRDTEQPGTQFRFVIGIAGQSRLVDRLLGEHKIRLPTESESLCVQRLPSKTGETILVAGRDPRGLSYALLDLARAIELTRDKTSWQEAISPQIEKPFLRHRSVTIHLANRDLDASWYFDEEFWRDYFATLARNRFYNFTLTFADQMNYLNPVYAHLVDVPGFEEVKASDVTAEGKRRNLKMLRRITELADERGVDFTFGVWTQQPVEAFGGEITVNQMPTGRQFMAYCAGGFLPS